MIVKADTALRPLEEVIDQIERHGTVDVSERGAPVFKPPGECQWMDIAPAIAGLADTFEIYASRHGREINVRPLRVLCAALESGADVTQTNLTELHTLMPRLRAISARFGQKEAVDLVRVTEIKAELETCK
ncbi:hypothetical protein RBI22_15340 [Alcaligenaceae bacterium C4P045]|nr:hypothetical protein [Alcaligenaceae bacterium C4P045]